MAAALTGLVFIGGLLHFTMRAVSRTPDSTGRTKAEMSHLSIGLQLYRQEFGSFPEATGNAELIQALTRNNPRKLSFYSLSPGRYPDGVLLDGWERPFVFEKTETGFLIRSAGKDGVLDTKDDLETTVPPPPPAPR
ncbi:MAG: type II secretion system protein GspG [Verrucomicrobiota bacterium]